MQRVVIVGAGVTGLSAAYHLAKHRAGQVILIDKGHVGDGSSQRAAGIITGLLWTEAGVLVRKRCLELFIELSDELPGYRFQNVGCLNLFSRDSWPEREKLLPLYMKLGAPYEIMNQYDITKRWPAMRPAGDLIGLFDPCGGYSEPDEYIPALRQRVIDLGVEVRENQMVHGFKLEGGRMTAVETSNGWIQCDAVIVTVYSWTSVLLAKIGLKLPVKCFVHQRYVTAPLPEPAAIPAVNAGPYSGYFRPAVGDRILAGIESAERDEYSVDSLSFHMSEVTAPRELVSELRIRLALLLPVLTAAGWESEKVGLLTFSLDGEPILGPVQQVPGLFVGLAFHSGGFAYNSGSGELLAQYVMHGTTTMDVTTWSPDRFNPEDTEKFLATRMAQKDLVRRRH